MTEITTVCNPKNYTYMRRECIFAKFYKLDTKFKTQASSYKKLQKLQNEKDDNHKPLVVVRAHINFKKVKQYEAFDNFFK